MIKKISCLVKGHKEGIEVTEYDNQNFQCQAKKEIKCVRCKKKLSERNLSVLEYDLHQTHKRMSEAVGKKLFLN